MSLDINFDLDSALRAGLETRLSVESYIPLNSVDVHYDVLHDMRVPGYPHWRTYCYYQEEPEKKPIAYANYDSNSDFRTAFLEWLDKEDIPYDEF